MKVLAKVISNKSSVTILNLLFHNELTANDIARETNMSLQLVKYYLDKMQQIDLIHVSKTGKNSKARDMNYYKTSKLAIIITPSKITEKTRQSKSLVPLLSLNFQVLWNGHSFCNCSTIFDDGFCRKQYA